MTLRIFVSGKFFDKPLIKSKMTELINLGYLITHDWTISNETPGDKRDAKMSAMLDIGGVQNCDVHVVIISDKKYPYRGTFCEMGCSMGLNKKILVWNPFKDALCMNVPFYYHPSVSHFETWEELLENLKNI